MLHLRLVVAVVEVFLETADFLSWPVIFFGRVLYFLLEFKIKLSVFTHFCNFKTVSGNYQMASMVSQDMSAWYRALYTLLTKIRRVILTSLEASSIMSSGVPLHLPPETWPWERGYSLSFRLENSFTTTRLGLLKKLHCGFTDAAIWQTVFLLIHLWFQSLRINRGHILCQLLPCWC